MLPTTYFIDAAFTGPDWLKWAMLGVMLLGIALGGMFFADYRWTDHVQRGPPGYVRGSTTVS